MVPPRDVLGGRYILLSVALRSRTSLHSIVALTLLIQIKYRRFLRGRDNDDTHKEVQRQGAKLRKDKNYQPIYPLDLSEAQRIRTSLLQMFCHLILM